MTAMHPHELEEIEYRSGPVLWDATPGVCCAAYQLGACDHTEAWDSDFYAEEEARWRAENPAEAAAQDAAHAAWLAEEEARRAETAGDPF